MYNAYVSKEWQVIYDPDPRATVVEADAERRWNRGGAGEAEQVEAYEGASQGGAQEGGGMFQQMSPWVVRCYLNDDALEGNLDDKAITADEVRGVAEETCRRECGCDGSAVTSFQVTEIDGFNWVALRVRLLASGGMGTHVQRKASSATAKDFFAKMVEITPNEDTTACAGKAPSKLTICCPDGTAYKLTASPSTTVLEVKQHVRRTAQGAVADARSTADNSARPFFWQDEHAVQRQHIFMHGV